MTEAEIREMFHNVLQERGIYKKIGVERSYVSNWKGPRPASFAVMLEVLYKLNKITITANAEPGAA
jgi:hypothetical protein